MKKLIIILLLTPLVGLTQTDTIFNKEGEIISVSQLRISNLINRYKEILKKKDGVDGWSLQIKFTSKRKEIIPYQIRFAKLYPEIPTKIIFQSPYYKLTVGNFRTKYEALKVKKEISKNFPNTHPISVVIEPDLFK